MIICRTSIWIGRAVDRFSAVEPAILPVGVTAGFLTVNAWSAAGLRYANLQFDGIGNAADTHRGAGNLFDVNLQAIENLFNAGVSIVSVLHSSRGLMAPKKSNFRKSESVV